MFYQELTFRISTLYVLNIYAANNAGFKYHHIQNPVKDSNFHREEYAVWCETELKPIFMEVKGIADEDLPQECSAVAIWFPHTEEECHHTARAILLSMGLDAKAWRTK